MFNFILMIIFILGLFFAGKLVSSVTKENTSKQMSWAIKYLFSSIIIIGVLIFLFMVLR